jgi:hypothetical protein
MAAPLAPVAAAAPLAPVAAAAPPIDRVAKLEAAIDELEHEWREAKKADKDEARINALLNAITAKSNLLQQANQAGTCALYSSRHASMPLPAAGRLAGALAPTRSSLRSACSICSPLSSLCAQPPWPWLPQQVSIRRSHTRGSAAAWCSARA